ncbi:type II secretion system secretin GspD [Gammaproteobacteria bacterium]|nr:type II secretion system secretin GspD [Gammaproteobacteria bacterium]
MYKRKKSKFFISLLIFLSFGVRAETGTWRINLKNADIREFVTQVSTITGKSFIIDPRVKGNVTVISSASMTAPGVYELFLSVLRVHGYAAVPNGDVIKIVQQVLAKQSSNPRDFFNNQSSEELITSVLPVRNSPAADLVKILRPLIPQYGHIAGIDSPNALIISDHAENVARMAKMIERIDISENQAIEIISLNEAWVEDMVELLKEIAPDQIGSNAKGPNKISIVGSTRTNSLIVKGQKETVGKILNLIKRLDVPANRSGSTQVVRLAHSDASELAELLKNIINTEKSVENENAVKASIQADEALNALVIRANPSTMLEVKDIIEKLDVRRLQVLIEAAIVEVTSDFSRQLGTELFVANTSSNNKTIPIGLTAPSGTLAQILQGIALGTQQPADLGAAPLIAAGREDSDGTSFGIIIRALSGNGDINLLSTPSITTMDNKAAKIVVGQNVPFRTGSTVTGSDGASNPFTTIQREDVGLTLEVTPHVHDGNLVRLEVHQVVSEVDPSSLNAIGAAGSADLITNKREINTTILVDNQEVIILGGLIRDKETISNSRVPVLGSIPGLGLLFKSSNKSIEKQNLLVFLRPTVLDSRPSISGVTNRKIGAVYEVEIEGTNSSDIVDDLFNGKAPQE